MNMQVQWKVGDRVKLNGQAGTVVSISPVNRKDWEGNWHPEWSRMVFVKWDTHTSVVQSVSWECPELLEKEVN